MQLITDITKVIADTLFPWSCLICNSGTEPVCTQCLAKYPTAQPQVCLMCMKPSLDGYTHEQCKTRVSPDWCWSMWDYQSDISTLIIQGKYYFYKDIFTVLGRYCGETLPRRAPWLLAPTVLCPVPLHSKRNRWRGFNQAEVFGRQIAESLEIPLEHILTRVSNTKTQKNLSADQRLLNTKDAFALTTDQKPWHDRFFEYHQLKPQLNLATQTILLVDDVRTTGATLRHATEILKRAGAASVYCLTLAAE